MFPSNQTSNAFGLILRTILNLLLPTLNSTSTTVPFPLIEFISWFFDILRCGLPNNAKDNASNIVDLPAPFCPTTNVVGVS